MAGEPQGQPGEGRGHQRHGGERAHLPGQPVGGRQHHRQQVVVPRVLLAVRADRIALLRLDRAVHEVAPVPVRVVVGEVGVEVVGQAVGEQQVERLVAVRLAVAGRPGEDGEIDRQRQQEEEDRRPPRQPLAEQRPERHRLPRHPAAEDEQEPGGEDLVDRRQAPDAERARTSRIRTASAPSSPAVDATPSRPPPRRAPQRWISRRAARISGRITSVPRKPSSAGIGRRRSSRTAAATERNKGPKGLQRLQGRSRPGCCREFLVSLMSLLSLSSLVSPLTAGSPTDTRRPRAPAAPPAPARCAATRRAPAAPGSIASGSAAPGSPPPPRRSRAAAP